MKSALIYSLKVWLTAVVLAPIITEISSHVARTSSTDESWFYFILVSIPYGLFLSLPCWFLLWVATFLAMRTSLSQTNRKLLLSLLGFILTLAPFYMVFGRDDGWKNVGLQIWGLSYDITIVAGIWAYKLRVVTNVSL